MMEDVTGTLTTTIIKGNKETWPRLIVILQTNQPIFGRHQLSFKLIPSSPPKKEIGSGPSDPRDGIASKNTF